MRTGNDYAAGLRDGRRVYINGDLVDDVTTHAAFEGAVRSVANLYDLACDPVNRDLLTFKSPSTGLAVNRSFTIPRSEDDLVQRRRALKTLSEATFGMMGRSPEHVAGILAAFAGDS